jgi:hypothetical protein
MVGSPPLNIGGDRWYACDFFGKVQVGDPMRFIIEFDVWKKRVEDRILSPHPTRISGLP